MSSYVLHDFPRASSAYRVRIALALKGVEYITKPVDFRQDEQRSEDYLAVNAAGLVPALETPDGFVITQSLAIIGYLNRLDGPRLYPEKPIDRAIVDAMALTVACDIHPLNNLRILRYLEHELGCDDADRNRWYAEWVTRGFVALEALVRSHGGLCCFGDEVSAADICLVPQIYNARRFDLSLERFPALVERDERLRSREPFVAARPKN